MGNTEGTAAAPAPEPAPAPAPPEDSKASAGGDDEVVDKSAAPAASGGSAMLLSRQRTFNMKKGSMRFQKGVTLKANLAATLQGGVDVKAAVKLPPDEDLNEWLAINTFLFYEIATNVYKSCEGICTETSCPSMTAGAAVVYLWADGKKVKKPVDLPAPKYVEALFEWVFEQLSDPTIFPQDDDAKFPKNFKKVVQTIYKRLFRVYAHLFHSHFSQLQEIGAEAHLNSSFKHILYFILEFDLVEEQELKPLKDLIKILLDKDK